MEIVVEIQPVDLILPNKTTIHVMFHISEMSPNDPQKIRLVLTYRHRELIQTESDYFTAMQNIRRVLEKDGIRLHCYGASKNVYPSPMAFDMGPVEKAYKLTLGQQTKISDLVSIFDSGPDVELSTVDEQRAFYEAWGESLR